MSPPLLHPLRAIQNFMAHPRTFLRAHPVIIGQFLGIQSGNHAVTMIAASMHDAHRPGRILGNLRTHNVQSFEFAAQAPVAIAGGGMAPPVSAQVNIQLVQMYQSNPAVLFPAIAGAHWYQLTPYPHVMITTKLTGCSFVVNEVGGNIRCAHIQPNGETGDALNDRLLRAGYTAVYGKRNYPDQQAANIIGTNFEGRWKIYAQVTGRMDRNIISTTRIYPT